VRRGLAGSRESARALVESGAVLVGGAPAGKPARMVSESEPVVVVGGTARFASRGGDKLDAALDRFVIDVTDRRCLDAGASTGGFTDCLLQRGAAAVVAVDVGYGQLAPRVRRDPRVTVRERTNVRALPADDVPDGGFDLVVADLSFISLTTVAPVLAGAVAAPGADVVVLVKPQFEAGRAEVSRGRGVIRDPAVRRRALGAVASAIASQGATIMGAMASPLLGPAGNAEFLLHARAHTALLGAGTGPVGPAPAVADAPDAAVAAMLDAAVADAPDAAVADAPARGAPDPAGG